MSIHSKFLIHWTGKDFHGGFITLTEKIREQYVQRLWNDCEEGFFMQKGPETVRGEGGVRVTGDIARVCFSEIRLSQAYEHAIKYGMLGIGVDRDFLIKRGGNPVIYLINGDTDMITKNIYLLFNFLKNKVENQSMFNTLGFIMGFMKSMSERENDSQFSWYEEMEWRIVHSNTFEKYFTPVDTNQYIYRARFKPEDIRILVFPDPLTKQMAFENDDIKRFFYRGFPMMTTIDDCKSF